MKQFYVDLSNWIETINKKSQELTAEEYWSFIFQTADMLKEKYNSHELVANVISVHINYLVALSDDLPF